MGTENSAVSHSAEVEASAEVDPSAEVEAYMLAYLRYLENYPLEGCQSHFQRDKRTEGVIEFMERYARELTEEMRIEA